MSTLLELAQARVSLKRRGNAYWGCCPWHKDKTSSFKVEQYRGKWRYHCFSCHEGGDAIDWLMRWENLSFKQASEQLGKPAKPDPILIAARAAEQRRRQIISAFRDRQPDSDCPDWLIAT